MKVIFILFLVINNALKHCQAEETVINSDACTAERLKVIDIILITKYVDKKYLTYPENSSGGGFLFLVKNFRNNYFLRKQSHIVAMKMGNHFV